MFQDIPERVKNVNANVNITHTASLGAFSPLLMTRGTPTLEGPTQGGDQ
jgi:hypothetical protein